MDIFVVLTGRRGHGKDTVADIAIEKFKCSAKVALADWFKEELSKEFRIPIERFYDQKLKEEPFEKPVVVQRKNLRSLLLKIGEYGFMNVNRLSTVKWEGRELKTTRDMMLWFGHDLVTVCCGDDFHCKVTDEQRIADLPRKPNHANIFFITDARKYLQSKYFVEKYKHVFPIKVTMPNGSHDDHMVERAVDEFPPDYFFAELKNDGDLKDLEEKVHKMLLAIKKSVKKSKTVVE